MTIDQDHTAIFFLPPQQICEVIHFFIFDPNICNLSHIWFDDKNRFVPHHSFQIPIRMPPGTLPLLNASPFVIWSGPTMENQPNIKEYFFRGSLIVV